MAIITAGEVRLMTDLTTTDISDPKLISMIQYAWGQVQEDIGLRIREEVVDYIDGYRENDIDGSNTTFYVKNSYTRYFGDWDGDGDSLEVSDIEVFEYNNNNIRTQLTVATINANGQFTTSTAPASSSNVTVNYISLPLPMTNYLVKKALIELSAALTYSKLDSQGIQKVRLGRLAVDKNRGSSTFSSWYSRYQQTLDQINKRDMFQKQVDDVKLPTIEILHEVPNQGGSI